MRVFKPVTSLFIQEFLATSNGYTPLWISVARCLIAEGLLVGVSFSNKSESTYINVSDGVVSVWARFSDHPARKKHAYDFDFYSEKPLGVEQTTQRITNRLKSRRLEKQREFRTKRGYAGSKALKKRYRK